MSLPVSSTPSWHRSTLRTLSELAKLPDNWDGYGSPPIRAVALESARRLLTTLEKEDLPVPAVFPVTGGGLNLNWELPNRELDIEILPDGAIEYLLVIANEETGQETSEEGRLTPSNDDPLALVRHFAQANHAEPR